MSDHIVGTVAKISEKPTRNGGTVYNICLDTGQDDEWFGHGFDEPQFQEGDEIEFDVSYNGDFANIDVDTVNVLAEGDGGGRKSSRGSSRTSSRSSSRSNSSSNRGGSNSRSSSSRSSSKRSSSRPSRGAAKSSAPAKSDTMSKDEWKQKDNMIRRQACMNTAIALIRGALECGAVKLPAKANDKLDAYIALCDEEAVRLYDQYEEQVYGKKPARGGRSQRNTQDDEDQYDDDIPQ